MTEIEEDYFRVLTGGVKFDKEEYEHRVLMNEIKRLLLDKDNTPILSTRELAKSINKKK